MRWNYRILLSALFALSIWILAACGNGGNIIDNELPGSQTNPEDVVKGGDDRLPDAALPTVSEIYGQIELLNLTLAEEPVNGVETVSSVQVSQILQEEILVRLLDPGDDILIATVNPDLTGHFKVTLTKEYPVVNVEVAFNVIEDLNGDGEENDPVTQSFPVAPKLGKAASLEAKFSGSLAQDGPASPDLVDRPMVHTDLLPEAGFMLVTELVVLDANGEHDDIYGINFETNTIVYDTDDDKTLEFGDDYVGEDSDYNGLVDSFEDAAYVADTPDPATEFLYGVITGVDSAEAIMKVRIADGSIVTVLVDPRVAIELIEYSETLDVNEFNGLLTLDSGLVGRNCQVIALPVTDGFLAEWILISAEPTPAALMTTT